MERTLKDRHQDAITLHMIEGNPFTAADEALFAMFDRENMGEEERAEYIKTLYSSQALQSAE